MDETLKNSTTLLCLCALKCASTVYRFMNAVNAMNASTVITRKGASTAML